MVVKHREMNKSSTLKISEITKHFHVDGQVVEAIDKVSFVLNPGERLALVGPNGSGKTTLLNLIMGLVSPDSGSVAVDDMDITPMPVHLRARAFSKVAQHLEDATFGRLTVEENLRLALYRSGINPLHKSKTDIPSWLSEKFPWINERRSQQAAFLSGGERQVLAVVMQLLAAKKLILLDEFDQYLDENVREELIYTTLSFLSDRKISTLWVTHNLELAKEIGNGIIALDAGQLVFDSRTHKDAGSAEELLRRKFKWT